MHLQLAFVLSCTNDNGIVQTVDGGEPLAVRFAAPIVEYGITIQPDQLVAIDHSVTPPQLVFRFPCAGDHAININDEVYDIGTERRPGVFQQVQQVAFPMIEALYTNTVHVAAAQIKNVVRQSYDAIAEEFLAWAQRNRREERERYTAILFTELAPNARVLELGCGAGLPTTKQLAARFQVTGVDISSRQIELVRQYVPAAEFLCADMTQLAFYADSFDAVAAFYSLIHVPREEQPQLLRNIHSWLRPGGLFVALVGAHAQRVGYEADWLGAPMYWSSFDSATNQQMVEEAGFRIISTEEETALEGGEEVTFLGIVAQKAMLG